MRTAILDYLKANRKNLTPVSVSEGLPWDDNGAPLYHHNKKQLFVDIDVVSQDPMTDAFNGKGIIQETTIVRAYFVSDAKNPIPNLESIIATTKDARLTEDIVGVINRTCQVRQSYIADGLVTEFEFSFRKLITN
jgi:hypothetical protein